MATFTSKAAGLASASGQTTWNESGTPTTGDTVVISHAVDFDYAVTLAAITFGSGAIDITMTVSAAITVTGDVTWASSSTGQYDATRFNTLHFASGGKVIIRPASGQTKSWYPATVAKFKMTGDVWLEFDDADGGVAAYMTRGAADFAQNFRTCMLDCTSLTLVNMGKDNAFGGHFTFYGSVDCDCVSVYADHSSLFLESNASFGYSGVLTVTDVAIDTPEPVGAFYEGLTINVSTAVVSRIVTKNARFFGTSLDSVEEVVEYMDTADSEWWPRKNGITRWAGIWNAAADNPHILLPSGSDIFVECPKANITTDAGDLYPPGSVDQTISRLIVPLVRTGTYAGKIPGCIHLADTVDLNFTLEHSVLATTSGVYGPGSAILSGESTEVSRVNRMADCRNNIFYGSNLIVSDINATPVEDNYPAAVFHHNLLDTNMLTGTALGISSTVTSSSGTYNANSQTVGSVTFKHSFHFADWAYSRNGTLTDENGIALLLADPSLCTDFFDFVFDGAKCANAEAEGTGEGGVDMGVGYEAATTSKTPVPIRSMMTMTGKRRILVPAG